MIIPTTIIETLHYILREIGEANMAKLINLVYLADKYHLIRYGRTITNDDYYATEHGIVGATLKEILSFNMFNLTDQENEYLSKLIEKTGQYTFKAKGNIDIPFDMLSDSDREALDFIIEHFGNMDLWQLSEYTHQYPEWCQYEDSFKKGLIKKERIETHALLSTIENDPLGMPEEHIRETKEILTGQFK